jgi:hypothetical protein
MRAMQWAVAGLLVGVGGATGAGQAGERSYFEQDGRWFRSDAQGVWRVDPDTISVRFRAPIGGLEQFLALTERQAGDEVLWQLAVTRTNRLGIHDLRVPAGSDVLAIVARLRASPLVELAEENTLGAWLGVPDDQLFPLQWALMNTGQSGGTPGADIDAPGAWDVTAGDPSIVIAIVDSGLDVRHPDLFDNLWKNPGEIPANGLDDDGNGFVDDHDGWDFFNGGPGVYGVSSHGTVVAGVAAARTNNVLGVAGVAGGFHGGDGCRLMPLRVGDMFPSGAVVDDAIVYAVDGGARVVNISFAIAQSAAIDAALAYGHSHGVFLVAASGNGASPVQYPAKHPLVVAVTGTDEFDLPATSVGGPANWVAAPIEVLSTTQGGGYTTGSGTSYSSAQVAGLAGLMLALLPSLAPDSIRDVLRLTADDVGAPGFDDLTGWGRIDARRALEHLLASDCNANGVYDPEDIAAGTSFDVNANGIPDECEQTVFCTAKVNSCGGSPAIAASGLPSATASAGFVLTMSGARNGKTALVLYTDKGALVPAQPFQGGFLCITSPRRSPLAVAGGGSAGQCDASFAFDMNAYAAGSAGQPAPFLSVPGQAVDVQWWARDTFAFGNVLSDALEYHVGP